MLISLSNTFDLGDDVPAAYTNIEDSVYFKVEY